MRVGSLEVVVLDSRSQVEQVVSGGAEVLDGGHVEAEVEPLLVDACSVCVKQFLQLGGLLKEHPQERAGELEILRSGVHHAVGRGHQNQRALVDELAEDFAVNGNGGHDAAEKSEKFLENDRIIRTVIAHWRFSSTQADFCGKSLEKMRPRGVQPHSMMIWPRERSASRLLNSSTWLAGISPRMASPAAE